MASVSSYLITRCLVWIAIWLFCFFPFEFAARMTGRHNWANAADLAAFVVFGLVLIFPT